MNYIENPKTKDSGIICCIPQTGRCPNKCEDCFFQSGRSYLEPLDEHLPNIPPYELWHNHVVRINDGNDSNVQRDVVIEKTKFFPFKFYNTAIPKDLDKFPGPVVLTLNPGKHTDHSWHSVEAYKNLMFVRFRCNTWNLETCDQAIQHYTSQCIPVVLTFMAYYDGESIPPEHRDNYMLRKRTMNEYYAITTDAWRKVMKRYEDNLFVYSCGKLEGEKGKTSCKYCGNCLREYFSTIEDMSRES